MKKLRLKYNDSNEAEVLNNSKRNWVAMKANLLDCEQAQFVKLIEKFGAHLEDLKVDHWWNVHEDSFRAVLKNLPKLKSLELSNISIKNSYNETTAPINLLQLTDLQFRRIYFETNSVLEILSAPLLKTLVIIPAWRLKELTNFLNSVPKLETLTCDAGAIIRSFKASKEGFPFKLKSLHCEDSWVCGNEEDFCTFLRSQSASFEEIDAYFKSQGAFEILLTKMKRLQIWSHANLSALPTDEQFYRQLNPSQIKEIHGYHSFPNETAAQGILGNCPHLEVLDIPRDTIVPTMLPFLAANNSKLKTLKIEQLGIAETRLPALKTLDIRLNNRFLLEPFLRWNPTIDHLAFNFDFFHRAADIRFLAEYRHVKRLTAGGIDNLFDLKKFYVAIKTNPGSIEKIQLKPYDDDDWLNFTFPEDQSTWSQRQKDFDRDAIQVLRSMLFSIR